MLNGRRIIIQLAVVLATCFFTTSANAETKWLITPEEAARIRPPSANYFLPLSVKKGPGPRIIVKDPKAFETLRSPVNIFVVFEPGKSGHSPAMDTLKVTLIGFFNIDITDRVREYIKGSNLEVKEASLPSGSHRLRMSIKDVSGNPNERDLLVTVAD